MTGKLIINARGESAKAMAADGGVRVQMTALADNVTLLPVPATHIPSAWNQSCGEVTFAKREAVALALQILDAAGYCAAVAPAKDYHVEIGQIRPQPQVEELVTRPTNTNHPVDDAERQP